MSRKTSPVKWRTSARRASRESGCAASIELARHPRVDADGGGAGGGEAGGGAASRLVAFAQPGTDLDRHGDATLDGVDHLRDDRRGASGRSGPRRAGAGLDDLADGARHVEVHDVGADADVLADAAAPKSWKPRGCSSGPHVR